MADKINYKTIANKIADAYKTNSTINIQDIKDHVTDKKKSVQSLVLALYGKALSKKGKMR